jgi:hypothetical protein
VNLGVSTLQECNFINNWSDKIFFFVLSHQMGSLKERDHWGDPDMDGRIILRWIFRKWEGDWNERAQDRDRWRALVSTVMNFRVQ